METIIKTFNELTNDELYDIMALRTDVFYLEQHCDCSELDGKDKITLHVFLKEKEEIIAYLRILDKGVAFAEVGIGRVVVKYRRKGYGIYLMKEAIKYIQDVMHENTIRIEAQVYAIPFYQKAGFKIVSGEFMDAGIPHVQMLLEK